MTKSNLVTIRIDPLFTISSITFSTTRSTGFAGEDFPFSGVAQGAIPGLEVIFFANGLEVRRTVTGPAGQFSTTIVFPSAGSFVVEVQVADVVGGILLPITVQPKVFSPQSCYTWLVAVGMAVNGQLPYSANYRVTYNTSGGQMKEVVEPGGFILGSDAQERSQPWFITEVCGPVDLPLGPVPLPPTNVGSQVTVQHRFTGLQAGYQNYEFTGQILDALGNPITEEVRLYQNSIDPNGNRQERISASVGYDPRRTPPSYFSSAGLPPGRWTIWFETSGWDFNWQPTKTPSGIKSPEVVISVPA